MKKSVKLAIIGMVILILSLISYSIMICSKSLNQNTEERLDSVVELILSDEIKTLTSSKIEEIEVEVENILKNTRNNKIICKSYFILGYIDSINFKYDSAIELLNRAIPLFGNISNCKMKVHTYYELSKIYLTIGDNNKSNAFFNKMIQVCGEENIREEIVELSILRGNDLYSTEDGLRKAIDLMEETLALAKEIKYVGVIDAYYKLGVLYDYDGRDIQAINCKLEALKLAEENGLRKKSLEINIDIGRNYLYIGNYSEAVRYFKKVLSSELEDETKDNETKSIALLYLAECFSNISEYESADRCFEILDEKIYYVADREQREDCIIYMYVIRADLESRKGNYKEALRLLEEAESRVNEKSNLNFNNVDVRLKEELGDAYYVQGDFLKSLEYHKEAQALATEKNLVYLEVNHNEKLYLDYKALGDNDNTIKYLEKNNDLKTKLKDNQDRQYSQFLITKFERENSIKRISELEGHKKVMNSLLIGLIIITGVIIGFSCFIFKKNKEIKRLNKLFKNLSITDGLTKLPNRRALDEYLAGNWSLYQKTYMPISFVMIDIDFFKDYNDNYGHPEGDKVLEKIAASINLSCRNSDFVARYGGEEFIVIMLNADKHEAIKVVERIQRDIHELNIKHEYSVVSDRISLSIGITTAYVGSTKDYDECINKADKALYMAKNNGRNNYIHI